MRPEPECFGPEATDRLRALARPGTPVWVAPDRDSWDQYRRRLFFVWTENGRLINYDLVAEGYAEAIRVRPNVTYWPLLRDTAAAAESARAGLWGACCSPCERWVAERRLCLDYEGADTLFRLRPRREDRVLRRRASASKTSTATRTKQSVGTVTR